MSTSDHRTGRLYRRARLAGAWTIIGLASAFGIAAVTGTAAAKSTVFETTTRSFADVVEQVSPAVVNISVTKSVQAMPAAGMHWQSRRGGNVMPFDDFLSRFFEMPGMPPAASRPVEALGSGFLIDKDGYIVTNNHVVDGAKTITVVLQDGTQLDAKLIGTDPKTDLALLKVDSPKSLPALQFGDSDKARVGDWVLAIGNPFGLGGSATAGIISARGRDIRSGPYDDFLQIDAPINSGNSGGPVFNADGQVIGVNTAIYSPNGGNVGIGFAIPAKQVKTVVDELKDAGTVRRGWLGIQIQDVDKQLAQGFGLDESNGALVADVVDDSPADRAGFKVGDVITRFGEQSIDSARALSLAVAAATPDEKVPVGIWRDGRRKVLQVKLGEAENDTQASASGPMNSGAAGDLGLSLGDLTRQDRRDLGLGDDYSGVVVTDVEPGSSAAEQGLRPGDVISRIGSKEVHNVDDATRAIKEAKSRGDRATLLVRRGDSQQFVSVALS